MSFCKSLYMAVRHWLWAHIRVCIYTDQACREYFCIFCMHPVCIGLVVLSMEIPLLDAPCTPYEEVWFPQCMAVLPIRKHRYEVIYLGFSLPLLLGGLESNFVLN